MQSREAAANGRAVNKATRDLFSCPGCIAFAVSLSFTAYIYPHPDLSFAIYIYSIEQELISILLTPHVCPLTLYKNMDLAISSGPSYTLHYSIPQFR